MKRIINRFKVLVLFILLFNSCKMKSQIFGYGLECEKANSIELAKVILYCVDEDKINEILIKHDNKAIVGVNLAIDSNGKIISLRIRDSSNMLNDSELEKITIKLRKSDFELKSCFHDNYFGDDKDKLLSRVVKNYKGGKVPVYIRFPGDLLNDFEGNNSLEEIKRQITESVK